VTDLALAKRNILLLAISQALYSCCVITVFATAGLVGLMALFGSVLPALRAVRVNPTSVMRTE